MDRNEPMKFSYEFNEAVYEHKRQSILERLRISSFRFPYSVILNILLTIFIVWRFLVEQPDPSISLYTPARAAVEYEEVRVVRALKSEPTIFQGLPNDELDERWRALYDDKMFLEISDKEKSQLPNNTLRWADEGHRDKWMMGLMVFHQLHCLDQIRMALHGSRYNMSIYNEDGSVNEGNFIHVDHCVDIMRQTITCQSDPNIFVFGWQPVLERVRVMFDTTHTCRNFDKISAWAKDRARHNFDDELFFRKAGDLIPIDTKID